MKIIEWLKNRRTETHEAEREVDDQQSEEKQEEEKNRPHENLMRYQLLADFDLRCRLECVRSADRTGSDDEAPTVTYCEGCKTRSKYVIGDELADCMEALYRQGEQKQKAMHKCQWGRVYEVEIPKRNTRFLLYPTSTTPGQDPGLEAFLRSGYRWTNGV